MNIPFLSIFEPAAKEPGFEAVFGEAAASAGGEFMLLLEAFSANTGSTRESDMARTGEVSLYTGMGPDSSVAGLGEGKMPGDEWPGLKDVLAASTGTASLSRSAIFTAPEQVEDLEPAYDTAHKDDISSTLPSHYVVSGSDDMTGTEHMDGRAVRYAVPEGKEELPGMALDADGTRPEKAVNPTQPESDIPETGIDDPGRAVQVSVPENPTQNGTDVLTGNPGQAAAYKDDTGSGNARDRGAVRSELKASPEPASANMPPLRDLSAVQAADERVWEIPQKSTYAETSFFGKEMKVPGLEYPSDSEYSGDAEAFGTDNAMKPFLKDNSVVSASVASDVAQAPALSPSPAYGAFAVGKEGQGSFASSAALAGSTTSDHAYDEAHTEEAAETVLADGAEEAPENDSGEAGFQTAFSKSEDGWEHEVSQAERPISGVLAGTSFRNRVESPLPPDRPDLLANVADIENQLDEAVRISVRNNGGEVRMKLSPEHLGELAIKLNISNGAVTAEITAESHEAKALLDAGSSMLKDSLAQQGLTLRECVVSVSSRTEPGTPERRDALFEERRNEAHGNNGDGKNGRKNGYGGGSGRRNANGRHAYGGIDLFA